MEYALTALRPAGLGGGARLDVFSTLTGFVANHVAYEIGQAGIADPSARSEAEARCLASVAVDGRHPELAEALAAPHRPLTPEATFARFLDRMVDGLDMDGS